MQKIIKTTLKTASTGIQAFLFTEDINTSLQQSRIINAEAEVITIVFSNFKHHAEIYDIVKHISEESNSALKVFEKFYLIVIPENKTLKVIISPKIKSEQGEYNDISGFMKDFKIFLKNHVTILQGSYDEIVFLD